MGLPSQEFDGGNPLFRRLAEPVLQVFLGLIVLVEKVFFDDFFDHIRCVANVRIIPAVLFFRLLIDLS